MNVERKQIQNGNMIIRYTHLIKKVKHITLRIDENGQLIVTSNGYEPQSKIDAFVLAKVSWIMAKQKKAIERSQMDYEDIMVEDVFYLFGKPLQVVRIFSNQNYVRHDGDKLFVYYSDENKAHKSVITFINKQCEKEFIPLVDYYFDKLQDYRLTYPVVKFKKMKSRWGSCTPSKQQIVLNTRMLHYPRTFLEYVVLHELVHFIQPNHSASFYQIIQFHMPDYKQRQKF